MSVSAQALVAGAVEITSLPEVYTRLDAAIEDPYSNLDDVGALLADDPALAARLLRLANSALYRFPAPVETITQAITVIGTKPLRELVLATSVIDMFQHVAPELVSQESFWRHSIGCGLAARAVAAWRRESNVERFYVAGLLHDLGRLVLYLKLPERAEAALAMSRREGLALHRAEQELLGFDHADVGAELLRYWQLPAALSEAVGGHHRPQRAHDYPLETATVHLADILANALRYGTSGECLVPALDTVGWEALGLEVSALEPLVELVEQQYDSAVNLFLGGH